MPTTTPESAPSPSLGSFTSINEPPRCRKTRWVSSKKFWFKGTNGMSLTRKLGYSIFVQWKSGIYQVLLGLGSQYSSSQVEHRQKPSPTPPPFKPNQMASQPPPVCASLQCQPSTAKLITPAGT